MTVDILQRISSALDMSVSYDVVFKAVCLVSYFSFLRKAQLLPDGAEFSEHIIWRNGVSFKPTHTKLFVRKTKTVQFGERNLVIPIP